LIPPLHLRTILLTLLAATLPLRSEAQTLAVAQAEASRCLDQIAAVRREVINKYGDTLLELQAQYQKAADLEGALAVRDERQRVEQESTLTEKEVVNDPRGLRAAQQQAITKIEDLTTALVNESVPKLIEVKKSLTIAGKLDDALAVRGLIEKLQGDFLRMERPEAGSIVTADTVIQAYAADRSRADKAYKGARMTLRGTVGAFRPDPNDAKSYVIYLRGSGNSGWIACFFSGGGVKFREDKQPNGSVLILTQRDGDVVARIEVNKTVDIQGECTGFEDVVRFGRCEISR
jgi:hypothetical protein